MEREPRRAVASPLRLGLEDIEHQILLVDSAVCIHLEQHATWLPRESEHLDVPMYEHATAIPGAGTVFSLLWMPDAA